MLNGIGSWLEKHSEKDPEKMALIYKDRRFNYGELNQRVNKLGHGLLSMGVRKGDRVASLLYNSNEQMELMFACAKIGAIFVPINYRLSSEEIAFIIQDSAAHHLFYDERFTSVVYSLRESVNEIVHYILVGPSLPSKDNTYEEVIMNMDTSTPNISVDMDDIHMMMYTSGTTGRPKGVMLTHGNTQWNAINGTHIMPLSENDSTLTVAPLFHSGGMSSITTPLIYRGGTVIVDEKFDPENTLRLVEKERITTLFLVPAMWLFITQLPDFNKYDISSLKFNLCGGAPTPITVIEFFQEKGIPFYQGFGITEAAPIVAILDAKNAMRKNGSIGIAPIHTNTRIVNSQGEDVSVGEVGELIVKGPNIMKGYWNKAKETQEAIKDGWFYSGDLAKMDDEGYLYIVDRKKDMIISGGENVYPIEIEQVLFKHPSIKEVAIVGIPDEKWGESVQAFIVLKNPNEKLTLEDVKEFCEGKLARFKIPKAIEFIEEIPRNGAGKVQKNILRSYKVKVTK